MSAINQTDNLSVDRAIKKITELIEPRRLTQKIASIESENQVLAVDLKAQKDIPAFDNSAMDGFLFLTKDLKQGKRTFKNVGEIRPEDNGSNGISSGTCMEIMTGAPVPSTKLTVVPVELTEKDGSDIEVKEVPKRNPIRKQGEGYKKGKTVLNKGTVIRPYEIGLMIESGNINCTILKPIELALQVTGSEIDDKRNSNGPVLRGLINHWPGTKVKEWPVLDDDLKLVKERMIKLKDTADIVLTTGGISMGKHDYILEAMIDLGAEIVVRKIQQKPGKPVTVAKLDDTLFFHLPGNPISAIFCAEMYVRRTVRHLNNLSQRSLKAVCAHSFENHRTNRTLFVTGELFLDKDQRLSVRSEGVMRSHLLQLYRNNNAYLRMDPETSYTKGDLIEVIPMTTETVI